MKTFSPRFRKALPVLLITAALALSLSAWGLWKYRFSRLEAPLKPLCINELSVSSLATQVGGSTIYEDYIELYNPNNNTISLDGLYLSDTSDYTLAPLPDVTIGPGAHLCIYAAGQDVSVPEGQLSVPFSLSENETVSLTRLEENTAGTASSVLLDTVYIPDSMKIGAVYARTEDGGETFAQMRPSPGTANQEAALVLEDPTFSQPSGFYEDAVSLQISSSSGTTVHYTLDGSDPTTDSPLYSGSLTLMDPSSHFDRYASRTDITEEDSGYLPPDSPVDKAVVLRAVAFDAAGNSSNITTATYFIDFDQKDGYENAAVFSLVTDPDNLFSSETGIYVRGALYDDAMEAGLIYNGLPWTYLTEYTNYYLEGAEAERPVYIQFFDASREETLAQDCGIRIRGNESRHFPQKSFSLYARSRYGSSSFSPVFFDTGISYPNLILNSGRQLKKIFFFSLVEDRDTAIQQYTPCQVFLNGEYWGMYYLMEKYSSEYLAGHYDVAPDNTLLVKDTRYVENGSPQDIARYKELRTFLAEQNLADPDVYQELLTKMDMQSFIDWMCTNIYIANTDTKPLGGNVLTWQTLTPENDAEGDGRFRWMLYDLDDSLAVGTDLAATPAYAFDSFTGHSAYSELGFLDNDPLPALMKNEDFRRQFVLTFLDMANESFRWEHVKALLENLEEQHAWADTGWMRWNTAPQTGTFEEQTAELHTFFEHRAEYIIPMLAEHFGLQGPLVDITLSSVPDKQGSIKLNTISPDLSETDWNGQYYTDYPMTVRTDSAKGYRFVRWEVDGGEIISGDVNDPEIQVHLSGDVRITAHFKKEIKLLHAKE